MSNFRERRQKALFGHDTLAGLILQFRRALRAMPPPLFSATLFSTIAVACVALVICHPSGVGELMG